MIRTLRITVIAVAMFLLAWVIKEILGSGTTTMTDKLVQKIRMSGV